MAIAGKTPIKPPYAKATKIIPMINFVHVPIHAVASIISPRVVEIPRLDVISPATSPRFSGKSFQDKALSRDYLLVQATFSCQVLLPLVHILFIDDLAVYHCHQDISSFNVNVFNFKQIRIKNYYVGIFTCF